MVGIGFSHRVETRLEHRLSLRHEVALTIRNTVITPEGICPKCGHEMTEADVRAGWRSDPLDFTTKCPECNERFEAHLVLTQEGENVGRHVYLCPDQLLHALSRVQRGKSKRLGIVYLSQRYPHLLWNIIRHFGTYERGLATFREKY